MPGVRLRHPTLRNCTYTLIHQGRPIRAKEPIVCLVCGMTHHHKTYHLALDALGEVVVSETVFKNIEEAGLDELQAVGQVNDPEPLIIQHGSFVQPLVVSRENGSKPLRRR